MGNQRHRDWVRRSVAASIAALAFAAAPARSEDSAIVEAGPQYRAGWLSRVFFGGQWRDLWTTPMKVPVLDLARFDGGLSPVREGGGLQTKNLHLDSGNGRSWVFRSVDKDMTRVLDPELRESLISAIFQDLTSTANPAAALVVAPLLDAAGVLHADPQLAVMSDDARLGEFRARFAGVLGILEQRIEKDIPGEEKVQSTFDLLRRLERRGDEQVDARAYLRARLMDIFVGDWDRHLDQWRWVRFSQEGVRRWHPVPRDRDQAFSRFDGLFPAAGEYYTKQLASFRASYPSIEKLTYSGRFTDRRFLVSLERPEWTTVTAALVSRLTDAVIADAVRRLPPELYAKRAEDLEGTLRSRRDRLAEASDEFYRLLAEYVDVRGTTGADDVAISRASDGSVEVTLSVRSEGAQPPFFRRRFLRGETREIRIYLLGGDDRVEASGPAAETIPVRVVARGGEGRFVDRTAAGEAQLETAKTVTWLHHFRGTVQAGPETSIDRSPDPAPPQGRRGEYEPVRDWGQDWLFFPQLSFDASRGLVAGGRVLLTRYGFELDPFQTQTNLSAAWSTGLNQPWLEYRGELRTRTPVTAVLYASYSGMDMVSFFGIGNETPRDPALVDRGYYAAQQDRLLVHPLLDVAIAGPLHGRAGLLLEHVSNEVRTPVAASDQYGFGRMTLGSGEIGIAADTRSGSLTAARGLSLQVSARHYPRLFSNEIPFSKVRGEVAAVLGARLLTDLLLTLRVAGERNWGRYPFFEAAFIGGAAAAPALDLTGATSGNLLRGYDLNRFAGDASVVSNADLRIALGRYSAVLPFRYGLVGLADVGRVFVTSQTSDRWHLGAGGGLWLALLAAGPGFEFVSTINAVIVRSDERTAFYLATGFGL